MNEILVDCPIPTEIPEPYRTWVRERNRAVGQMIAANYQALGLSPGPLTVLAAPTSYIDGAYYGVITPSISDLDKVTLHPTLSYEGQQAAYSELGGQAHSGGQASNLGLVLPGYSIFDTANLSEVYIAAEQLFAKGLTSLRLKEAAASDMAGQYPFTSLTELDSILQGSYAGQIPARGLVIEANLQNPTTVSVGEIKLSGKKFTTIAQQIDIKHDGRTKFGGAKVQVLAGSLEENSTSSCWSGIHQAAQFKRLQEELLGLQATRISYDIVSGTIVMNNGQSQVCSGITDITGRVGGTDIASQLAIAKLINSGTVMAAATVRLYYSGEVTNLAQGLYSSYEELRDQLNKQGAIIYLDDPKRLVIAAQTH